MNKKLAILILLSVLSIQVFSKPKKILPITDSILKDIDSDELLKKEFDLELYDLNYVELVWSWEEQFLSKLEMYPNESLLGKWILVDNEGKTPKKNISKYFSPPYFYLRILNNYFEYNFGETNSEIYFDGNDYYFNTLLYSVLLKKMVVDDDKIYFYVLKNGEWVLDPIHEGGIFYYVKDEE